MLPHLLAVVERAGRLALRAHGFESRKLPTRLGALHAYVSEGSGTLPPIVVLHAMAATATPFAQLLVRLKPHARRVIAIDMPGHGFSELPSATLTPRAIADAISEAIEHFGAEPKVLIGNSLGGAVALQLAIDAPQRVAALGLLSPAGARIAPHEWERLIDTFKVDSRAAALQLLGRIHHRKPWYLPAFSADFLACLQRSAVQDVLRSANPDDSFTPHELRSLSMPVLLVWGQSERILPRSAFEYFRKHLPVHARIEEPHGFGHCPHLDDPDRVATGLLNFVRHALRNKRKPAHARPAALPERRSA